MLANVRGGLIVGFVTALTIAVGAQQWSKPIEISPMPGGQVTPSSLGRAPLVPPGPPANPVRLIKAIAVPPLISSIDIMFVDQIRGRLYIADRTNCGIDVIDAVADTFITRIASSSFICSPVGGTANAGPNGVLVTPDNKLWFGDSNNTLQIVDLNAVTISSSQQVTTLTASQVTTKLALASQSHANSTRADELAYDPFNRVIAMANDGTSPPEVSFFNADTYAIRGSIQFPDANGIGLEQPVWSTRLHAFVINVPGPSEYLLVLPPSIYDAAGTQSTSSTLTRFPITDCPAATTSGAVNGLAYAPSLNLFAASGCTNGYLVNGDTGAVTKIPSVIGGDEVWYNEGDGQFYYVGLGAGNGFLSTVSATTGALVSQSFPSPATLTARMRNVAAYEGNNQIFSVSTRLTTTPETTPCTVQFNLPANSGCVLVWAH